MIERLHSETMNGLRITQQGKVTELYLNLLADGRIMHLNSINRFNGWETDAYLTGITYPQGTAASPDHISNYFVAYGSYLRYGSNTVFNSLSKLYLTADKKAGDWNVLLQGQPLIHASLYTGTVPHSFYLNHRKTAPVWSDQRLQITIRNKQDED
jgi:hypothetical protein